MNDDLASFDENWFPYYFLWPLSTYSLLPRHVDLLLHTAKYSSKQSSLEIFLGLFRE